jgi:thiamine-monophosphate kinase
LSDGLSTDLARICQASQLGARIRAERIPGPPASKKLSPTAALDLALNGGEDYELLFTVPSRKASLVPKMYRGVPLCLIGEIERGREVMLTFPGGRNTILKPAGYDHFAKDLSSSKKRH